MKAISQKVNGKVKKVGLLLESQEEIDKLGAIFHTQKIAKAMNINDKQISSLNKFWNVDRLIVFRDRLYNVI